MENIKTINNEDNLVAIGGTGQNIAISYLRLARIADFTPANIWLIDSDVNGNITKTLLNEAGRHSASIHMIKPTTVLGMRSTKFRDVLAGTDPRVVDALFSKNLLDIDISEGMFCRPIIGATSMNMKLQNILDKNEEEIQYDPEFSLLLNLIANTQHRKVAIAGSNFGGTGAGCLPVLSEYIARENKQTGPQNIYSLVVLPWFNLDAKNKNFDHEHGGADQDNMFKNAKSGTNYLIDKMSSIGSIMLMQTPGIAASVKYTGNSKQDESPHAIFLLSALNINNMLKGSGLEKGTLYSYAIPDGGATPESIRIELGGGQTTLLKDNVSLMINLNDFIQELIYFFEPPLRRKFNGKVMCRRALNFLYGMSDKKGINYAQFMNDLCDGFKKELEANESSIKWLQDISDNSSSKQKIFSLNMDNLNTKDKDIRNFDTPTLFFNKWLSDDRTLDFDGWIASSSETNTVAEKMCRALRQWLAARGA